MNRLLATLLVVAASLLITGCETAYYEAMEQIGVHKRDILVDRVSDAQEAQEEAKEQFASALEEFTAVVGFDGGDLEARYNDLNDAFEESEDKAQAVTDRIDAVERVSEALFAEWEEELAQYSSDSLRRSSERTMKATRTKYDRMVRAMRRAESRIDPVLDAFRDQVLFLKHNLNARAVASLKSELVTIEDDVALLIREMEASITEAQSFIQGLEETG